MSRSQLSLHKLLLVVDSEKGCPAGRARLRKGTWLLLQGCERKGKNAYFGPTQPPSRVQDVAMIQGVELESDRHRGPVHRDREPGVPKIPDSLLRQCPDAVLHAIDKLTR